MGAADRLSEIQTRADAATKGPTLYRYPHGHGRLAVFEGDRRRLVADFYNEADREFYTSARTDVPALVAALRAVLALADHVTETHAALPEPHGAFTRGYATALRDIRATIEGALLP